MWNNTTKTNFLYGVDADGVAIPFEEVKKSIRSEILEELKEGKRVSAKQSEAYKKIKSKDTLKMLVDESLGGFIFSHYEEILNILIDEKGGFDGALVFRFIYLSTFMDYNNKLRFGASYRLKDRGDMIEKDLKEILGLSKKQVWEFKNKVINLGLLTISKDNTLTINIKYCHKGAIKNSLKGDSIRIFEEGIQQLYRNSLPKEHKRLGMLIKLIPYLNKQHNILCFNVEEEKPLNILPLSIQDICNIVGHAVKNARRLEGELLKITVGGQPLIMKHSKFNSMIYSINPKLFYKGDNIESLQALINLFYIK